MLRLTAIFLFVSILATTPAAAQGASGDGLVYGYGLLCDTPEQVARYLAIASGGGDVGSAARAVNLEAGKDDACVLGASGFLVGSEVARMTVESGVYIIARIVVMSLLEKGQRNSCLPREQYAPFFLKTKEAGSPVVGASVFFHFSSRSRHTEFMQ